MNGTQNSSPNTLSVPQSFYFGKRCDSDSDSESGSGSGSVVSQISSNSSNQSPRSDASDCATAVSMSEAATTCFSLRLVLGTTQKIKALQAERNKTQANLQTAQLELHNSMRTDQASAQLSDQQCKQAKNASSLKERKDLTVTAILTTDTAIKSLKQSLELTNKVAKLKIDLENISNVIEESRALRKHSFEAIGSPFKKAGINIINAFIKGIATVTHFFTTQIPEAVRATFLNMRGDATSNQTPLDNQSTVSVDCPPSLKAVSLPQAKPSETSETERVKVTPKEPKDSKQIVDLDIITALYDKDDEDKKVNADAQYDSGADTVICHNGKHIPRKKPAPFISGERVEI